MPGYTRRRLYCKSDVYPFVAGSRLSSPGLLSCDPLSISPNLGDRGDQLVQYRDRISELGISPSQLRARSTSVGDHMMEQREQYHDLISQTPAEK